MRGRFITLEGGEGAGKSTMMGCVADWLEDSGHRVIRTREPGGTELAEKLRDILLDRNNHSLSGQVELLLMFAARAHHLRRWALPRGQFPDGRRGYLHWRREQAVRQADEVAELLASAGYDPPSIARVQQMIRKEVAELSSGFPLYPNRQPVT